MWKQACGIIVAAGVAFGQTFSGFTTGNLVVSRSVYTGSAATLAAGQPLPPVCPSTAACGTGKSVSGVYPTVWNNDIADGSFGVTSPLFLDQLTPAGTLVSTLAIPTSMVNTSFSSKSEVALNLSTDGTVITFMAYVTPANTVDVSNSNTPAAYDPTNPAGGSLLSRSGAGGGERRHPGDADKCLQRQQRTRGHSGKRPVLHGRQRE